MSVRETFDHARLWRYAICLLSYYFTMSLVVLFFSLGFLLYRAVTTAHPFLSGLLGGLMATVGGVNQ